MSAEYKIRQEIYHRLNPDHNDDLKNFEITISDDVVGDAVQYFTTRDIGWVYPGKSYMVGICYAKWLTDNFHGDPLDYLKDPDLLYGNDPYFKSFDQDPATYLEILAKIGGWNFSWHQGLVPDVRQYYLQEFMIDE